jgi:hypothetical protein
MLLAVGLADMLLAFDVERNAPLSSRASIRGATPERCELRAATVRDRATRDNRVLIRTGGDQ